MDVLKTALRLLALAFACLVAGFFLGRKTVPEPEIRYVERPQNSGSLDFSRLSPKTSLEAPKPLLKYVFIPLADSVESRGVLGPKSEALDTLSSLWETAKDWNTLRTYNETLFDDPDNGKLDLSFTVQYNKPGEVHWNYAPGAMKIVHNPRNKKMSPFVRVSVSTLGTAGIGGGLRVGSWAFDTSWLRDFQRQKNGVSVGVSYSF